jgi:DNA-binding response OmpR family regulator
MNQENKIKILIVEDDLLLLEGYAVTLKSEGFSVLKAKDGQEGLEVALKEKPDLILADILMPVMDGFEMLKELRQEQDYGKNVPVILLTNLSADNEDVVKKIAESAPAYFIVKSDLTFRKVVEKIKEVLAHKHLR